MAPSTFTTRAVACLAFLVLLRILLLHTGGESARTHRLVILQQPQSPSPPLPPPPPPRASTIQRADASGTIARASHSRRIRPRMTSPPPPPPLHIDRGEFVAAPASDAPASASDGAFRSCCADAWRAHWRGHSVDFCAESAATPPPSTLTCFEAAPPRAKTAAASAAADEDDDDDDDESTDSNEAAAGGGGIGIGSSISSKDATVWYCEAQRLHVNTSAISLGSSDLTVPTSAQKGECSRGASPSPLTHLTNRPRDTSLLGPSASSPLTTPAPPPPLTHRTNRPCDTSLLGPSPSSPHQNARSTSTSLTHLTNRPLLCCTNRPLLCYTQAFGSAARCSSTAHSIRPPSSGQSVSGCSAANCCPLPSPRYRTALPSTRHATASAPPHPPSPHPPPRRLLWSLCSLQGTR